MSGACRRLSIAEVKTQVQEEVTHENIDPLEHPFQVGRPRAGRRSLPKAVS
jgi:hypothetical protein